ncbi:MAG: indole-3-glycerol phosphate synthase TrpC [Candidatus Omnitrophica bacterium]|nr:indole-3-glycerol phosphate synthase TrpC [Candidatus Omnitrophota bacterium]
MSEAFLANILDYKRALIKEKRDFYFSLKWKVKKCARPHLFRDMLAGPGQIKLIAEVKKASPSRGLIREDFDPVSIAKIYAENNATAISVVTEDKYFLGKPEFVKQISKAVNIPILAKDFIIDEGQIHEALANGANAVLLIVAILDDVQLKGLIDRARSLGLDCLVEIHNTNELKRACAAGAEIIGVNNRDLHAFVVDMQTCKRLIPKVPEGKIIVGESGFKKYSEVKALKNIGAHGVLIGETFMREQDIGKKIRKVLYGQS